MDKAIVTQSKTPYAYYTIGDRLAESSGITSGFDYLRIVLAVSVLFFHSIVTSYGGQTQSEIAVRFPVILGPIVPMFFALSGFLVTASLFRSRSLVVFMALRALRILPALAVEIVVSALLLGPIVTTVSLQEYFSDNRFSSYFLNIFGYIHYELPGVFENNPYPNIVNGQLWTVPLELECYIVLGLLSILTVVKRPGLMIAGLFIGCAAMAARHAYGAYIGKIPWEGGVEGGRVLVACFIAGVIVHLMKDRLPYDFRLFVLASGVSLLCFEIPQPFMYCAPLFIAYATAYLGLRRPKKNRLILSGDYSYGIYLYSFAVQQFVSSMLPAYRIWYVNIVVSLTLTALIAVCSWHFIEKPTLQLKRFLKRDFVPKANSSAVS